MTIYYNNGETEKQIKGVINIEVIDGNHPVIALLNNGRELTISLDNIESIYDDTELQIGLIKKSLERRKESNER